MTHKIIRSFSGKARRVHVVREIGERVECIADDNGRTVIVSRYRLHRDSLILTGERTGKPSAEIIAALTRLIDYKIINVQK